MALLISSAVFTLYCSPPAPLSSNGSNVMMIGDSISMGSFGYSLFVRDMLQTMTNGTLVASVQHGGGFGGGGQMASSANGAAKVRDCMGNSSGMLRRKAWSVVTYNAGLHDCDTRERVLPDAYAANLRAVFETIQPAAAATIFVSTTPYDMPGDTDPHPAGINMSCVLEYNSIARKVASEVGAVVIDDLYSYVERFCGLWPTDPAPYRGNYTRCAIQTTTTGLHFFTTAPLPSGQQYTALAIAEAVMRHIPEASIQNTTSDALPAFLSASGSGAHADAPLSCGAPPAPLNRSLPNVLVIGDSISMPGVGYVDAVKALLEKPIRSAYGATGALAAVQHSGGAGDKQAGPSTNGVACIGTWLGSEKWDVITFNFGLHDACAGGDGRAPGVVVSESEYVANLEQIYNAASSALAPGGKIVWVTTTPVGSGANVSTCAGDGSFSARVELYNAAALRTLAAKPDVVVADLSSAVRDVCGSTYEQCNLQRWSNVHFTAAGRQFCAVHVAKTIAPLLAPKWAALMPNPTLALGLVER